MPGMGDIFRVKVPNGGWCHQPLAKDKGVHREVESEGSRRQSPDRKNMNPIRGQRRLGEAASDAEARWHPRARAGCGNTTSLVP